MDDLSARYNIALVPSSQEGGNLVQMDLAAKTMTAPGSEPVSPLPAAAEGAHPPEPAPSGPQVKVSDRPQAGKAWRPGGGSWSETPDADDQPDPSPRWKQL